MTHTPEQITKLHKLAVAKGVQTSYHSAFGTTVETTPAGLVIALNALGGVAELKEDLSNIDDIMAETVAESWKKPCEPVVVFWEGRVPEIPIRFAVPKTTKSKKLIAKITLKLESGKGFSVTLDLLKLPASCEETFEGTLFREVSVKLKRKIPFGYHEAKLMLGSARQTIMIISAPKKAYKPARGPKRSCGIFAPLYAVHSKQSWGIGDFNDLSRLMDWAYDLGCDFIGTLPMLSVFTDKPIVEPSPYSPLSRVHWNELYVDPRQAPEWKDCAKARELTESSPFRTEIEKLRATKEVDYRSVARLKRPILEAMAEFFFAKKRDKSREFKQFLKIYPSAADYAEFRAVCDKRNESWRNWPEPLRSGKIRKSDYNDRDRKTHLYAQWLAHRQLLAISEKSKKKGRGIYIDFPLSAHADGYDVWRDREAFAQVVSAGCPPDPAHVHGQDWGILPLNPQAIRLSKYGYFRRCLESHMRYAGLLRLDHVMCFYRLYWVPHGLGAKNGVYIRYRMEEFFALLVLESHRNQCTLIGEDLGTVPPEIREAMTEHGILRMYVQQRRLSTNKDEPLSPVPVDCICSLNTHDMPPFAAFWEGLDIVDKMQLGYFGPEELDAKKKAREDAKDALVTFLVKKGLLKEPTQDLKQILKAMLVLTAHDPVKVMQVNIEDLWLETLPQNVPGTWKERPNWKRKCRHGIEELPELGYKPLFQELIRLRKAGK
ncbi:MAG TPA: 4-alpha-glucanotransferase [Bdellovibrionota bacterium]|nr:4-alpha-glucanotransferase [Bdellovibrionota bacterium]